MPPALKAPQTLCGTAIRTKTFLQIKVHAFAIYVDAPAMARDLAAWKGIESKDLEHDRSFYQTMLEDNFDKTLRMILCRNVNSEDMREAFDDDLGPRVKRAGKELDMPGGVEALQTFKSFFNLGALRQLPGRQAHREEGREDRHGPCAGYPDQNQTRPGAAGGGLRQEIRR